MIRVRFLKLTMLGMTMLTTAWVCGCDPGGGSGAQSPDQEQRSSLQDSITSIPAPRDIPSSGASITPDPPTAQSDLRVLHSVRGQVAYQWERNGSAVPGAASDTLSRELFSKGDRISVIVRSSTGESAAAAVVIQNSSPSVVSAAYRPEYVCRERDVTVEAEVIDPDGDHVRLRYIWVVNGREIASESPVLKGDAFRKGEEIIIKIIPYDSDGDGIEYESRPIVAANASPRFVSMPPQSFSGDTYSYQVRAVDPDGDTLSYSLAAGPQGMAIDSKSGLLSWKIGKEQAGVHAVDIELQDSEGMKVNQRYSLNISVPRGEP